MHSVRCSVSFQVDIFVLANKDYVQIYRCKPIKCLNLAIIFWQFTHCKKSFAVLVPEGKPGVGTICVTWKGKENYYHGSMGSSHIPSCMQQSTWWSLRDCCIHSEREQC